MRIFLILMIIALPFAQAKERKIQPKLYWVKAKATTREQRSKIANSGVGIETVMDDYVIAIGSAGKEE